MLNNAAGKNPEFLRIATKCERQWVYQTGEEGIIYSETQNRFVGLDAAGLLAYQAFDAGASLDDLLVASGTSLMSIGALREIFALSQGQFPQPLGAGKPGKWAPMAARANANVQVHGIPMLVECSQDGPGGLCRDCFLSCPPTNLPARFHIRVHRTTASWSISVNDQEAFPSIQNEQAGLGMLHIVRSLLYDEAEYDVAFHAAMVADGSHGIMLCAPRESGKSTLSAHLVAQGFDFVTDEPALLRLNTESITPVKMPISLKEGAWRLLEDEWPRLANAPVHVRSDGIRVKLLHPSQDRVTESPQKLTHIIFLKYASTAVPQCETLLPIHTLIFLNHGGMLFGRQFDKAKFEQFLKLICATPAFSVEYSSLKQANLLLQALIKKS